MQVRSLPLTLLILAFFDLRLSASQTITQPPESTTAAQGTNATFTCRGDGLVFWKVGGTQATTSLLVSQFSQEQIYIPLPNQSYSELIMTATADNNFTRTIQCLVSLSSIGTPVESEMVRLIVYAEPNPPTNLMLAVDGMNLVATWIEPFSLEGEKISYVVSITNVASKTKKEVTTEVPRYILSQPLGDRDCAQYEFVVVSRNDFSISPTAVSGKQHIPTVPLMLRRSDINFNVSLDGEVGVTIMFNSSDPCPAYPVTSYTFNIAERDGNNHVASIRWNNNQPLVVDGSDGLVSSQVYQLVIEATNRIGSTLSEEVLFYTTGLQSSTAVMEPDGSITVTCTFAPGATSTGCQVTIFTMDGVQELFSRNITRSNEALQVEGSVVLPNFKMDSTLLVQTVELLGGGQIGNVLFNRTATVDVKRKSSDTSDHLTTVSTTHSVSTTGSQIQDIPTETSEKFVLYIIIAVVTGAVTVILLFLITLTLFILVSLGRKRQLKGLSTRDNVYESEVSPAYEIASRLPANSEADIQTNRNPVYAGIVVNSASERAPDPFYAELGPTYFTLHSGRSMRIHATPRPGAPLRPSTESGSSTSQCPSPYLVPQLSSRTENGNVLPINDIPPKNYPSPYCVPSTRSSKNGEGNVEPNNDISTKNDPSPYCVPSTQSSKNEEGITGVPVQPMSNGQDVTVANDHELVLYTAQVPSGIGTVNSVNENIEINDPVKQHGDGQEQQSNNLKLPGTLDTL